MFHGSHTSLRLPAMDLEGGAGCDEPTGLSPPPKSGCRHSLLPRDSEIGVRLRCPRCPRAWLQQRPGRGKHKQQAASSRQHADDDERSSSCSRALVLSCPVHRSYAWIRWDHRLLIAGLQRQLPGRQLFICIAM